MPAVALVDGVLVAGKRHDPAGRCQGEKECRPVGTQRRRGAGRTGGDEGGFRAAQADRGVAGAEPGNLAKDVLVTFGEGAFGREHAGFLGWEGVSGAGSGRGSRPRRRCAGHRGRWLEGPAADGGKRCGVKHRVARGPLHPRFPGIAVRAEEGADEDDAGQVQFDRARRVLGGRGGRRNRGLAMSGGAAGAGSALLAASACAATPGAPPGWPGVPAWVGRRVGAGAALPDAGMAGVRPAGPCGDPRGGVGAEGFRWPAVLVAEVPPWPGPAPAGCGRPMAARRAVRTKRIRSRAPEAASDRPPKGRAGCRLWQSVRRLARPRWGAGGPCGLPLQGVGLAGLRWGSVRPEAVQLPLGAARWLAGTGAAAAGRWRAAGAAAWRTAGAGRAVGFR